MQDATRALEDAAWAAAEGTATASAARAARGRPARAGAATLERLLDDTEDQLDAVRLHHRARARPGGGRLRGRADHARGRLRPAHPRRRPGGRHRRRRPGRRGPPPGVVGRRAGRGVGRRPGHRRRPTTTSWPTGSRPSAAPSSAGASTPTSRSRPAAGPPPCPSRSRSRSAGWSPSAAASAATASAPASPGWAGWPSRRCASWPAARSCPTLRGHEAARRARASTSPCAGSPALVDHGRARRARRGHARRRSPLLAAGDARAITLDVLGAVVDAIVREAAGQLELPAPPPTTRTTAAVAEAFITRLDGSALRGPGRRRRRGVQAPRPLGQAASPAPARSSRLVVQLDPPDTRQRLVPVGARPRRRGRPAARSRWPSPTASATKPLADELARLERILPALLRPGGLRRGQVYLSQAEAWELMTVTGALARGRRLRGAGAGAVAPQAVARACGCSPSPPATRWSAPTS